MTTSADERPTGQPEKAAARSSLIIFDVNETLSDLSPLAGRFTDVGAPEHLASTWFAELLRDGFALTAADEPARFAEIGRGLLDVELSDLTLDRSLDRAVEHIMSGFDALGLHPDVAPGIEALASLGLRLVTLSNGSTSVAEELLRRGGIAERFEQVLSVEDAGAWKPAAGSYRYALDECRATAAEAMLVAVHPWDIEGAHRVGLRTAWLNRGGRPYPRHFSQPDLEINTVGRLADILAGMTTAPDRSRGSGG